MLLVTHETRRNLGEKQHRVARVREVSCHQKGSTCALLQLMAVAHAHLCCGNQLYCGCTFPAPSASGDPCLGVTVDIWSEPLEYWYAYCGAAPLQGLA